MLKHYVLKSNSNLPTDAHFLDPFDKEAYTPTPGEDFPQFIKRIKDSRALKNKPRIDDTHLHQFVTVSLSQTIPPSRINQYFDTQDVPPTLTQVVGFAQTFWRALRDNQNISIRQRQERASGCLTCTLHIPVKNDGFFATAAETLTNLVTGPAQHETYEAEQKLGKCGMCGCNLKDKVKYTTYAVMVGVTSDDLEKILGLYGQHSFNKCWILREGLQEQPTNELINKRLSATNQGTHLLKVYHAQKAEQS